MRKITTGDIADALRKHFPQVTRDMIVYDVETGRLRCYPQFGPRGWNYAIADAIPEYLQVKQVPQAIAREVLKDLGLNFKQLSLQLVA